MESHLRTLSAVESSIINSTMLVQIALLAYLFLGETLNGQDIAGMAPGLARHAGCAGSASDRKT